MLVVEFAGLFIVSLAGRYSKKAERDWAMDCSGRSDLEEAASNGEGAIEAQSGGGFGVLGR